MRDVIAFPKTQNAIDPLFEAPGRGGGGAAQGAADQDSRVARRTPFKPRLCSRRRREIPVMPVVQHDVLERIAFDVFSAARYAGGRGENSRKPHSHGQSARPRLSRCLVHIQIWRHGPRRPRGLEQARGPEGEFAVPPHRRAGRSRHSCPDPGRGHRLREGGDFEHRHGGHPERDAHGEAGGVSHPDRRARG